MYKHPTGNKPKTIHIVCSGATTKDYLAANMGYERAIPKADEVWSLNKSLRSLKADFGFVLDDWVGEYRKSAAYMTDIARMTQTMPIMTTIRDNEVIVMTEQLGGNPDNVVRFPVEGIRDALGAHFYGLSKIGHPEGLSEAEYVRQKGNQFMYMKNSVPMILAYAWFIGVGAIYLFGADYTHPMSNAREADQPNAEFWCGFIEACGISLYLPSDTTLRSVRQGMDLYGYGVRQPAL